MTATTVVICPEELEVPIRDVRLQLILERKAHRAEGQELRDKIKRLTRASLECVFYIEENSRLRKEIGRLAKAAVEQQTCTEENNEKIKELARIVSDQNSCDEENSE